MSGLSGGKRVAALARFFEDLRPDRLDGLAGFYADDAWFCDPFNEVRGLPAIRALFEDMYRRLEEPGLRVTGNFSGADGVVLAWEFRFRFRGGVGAPHVIRGMSHLRFDAAGLVNWHRDYWDSAELYEKIPVLGTFVRALRRRAAHRA
ncbi:MAG TPA: nuclear transport factor 2 family protein [Burkholderiales bacterium]|nr:nuclear transport factor 2 family protein [Burkholderiales bacterium]